MPHYKEREKLLADRAVVEPELSRVRANMQAKIDQIQKFSDGETKRANDFQSGRARSLISGNSLKRQLQLRSEGTEEVEGLEYQLDGDAALER